MKKLFNFDNPFYQFITKVGNLIILNLLYFFCCLPVITIGASTAAMYKVTQALSMNTESGIRGTFFSAFRENFKQGTGAWLLQVFFFIGMGCNLMLTVNCLSGGAAIAAKFVLGVLTALGLGIFAYLFPLMARYRNTLREHFYNAMVLAVAKLPRTIVLVLFNILPFLIFRISLDVFVRSITFWLFIGFAFFAYLSSVLLIPVFKILEKEET